MSVIAALFAIIAIGAGVIWGWSMIADAINMAFPRK